MLLSEVNSEGANYDITMKRIECSDVDKRHILNLTCVIKAVRGKKGILNLYWIYKDVTDAFVSLLKLSETQITVFVYDSAPLSSSIVIPMVVISRISLMPQWICAR